MSILKIKQVESGLGSEFDFEENKEEREPVEAVSFFDSLKPVEEDYSKVLEKNLLGSVSSDSAVVHVDETSESESDDISMSYIPDIIDSDEDSEDEIDLRALLTPDLMKKAGVFAILVIALLSLGIPYFGYICGHGRGVLLNVVFILVLVSLGAGAVNLGLQLGVVVLKYIRSKNMI